MSLTLCVQINPQRGASYETVLGMACESERLGFDGFFTSDHYLDRSGGDGLPGPLDAWTTLAGLARETSRLRLGTLVNAATFRRPAPLAITVAQVDAMSGGRIELGLGAAWIEAEHTAYGIPFPALGERFDHLEEQLAIITGLWHTPIGGSFDFVGKHYQLAGAPGLPKPVQQPHPPIIIGGQGRRRTPALAARYAAEFNCGYSPDTIGDLMDLVRAACDEIGRDPGTMTWSVVQQLCCGEDEQAYQRRAAAIGADPDKMRKGHAAGTVPEVVDRLLSYDKAGMDRVYLQTADLADLDHLHLVAEQVLPALR